MADARKQYRYESDIYDKKRKDALDAKNIRNNQLKTTCDNEIQRIKNGLNSQSAQPENPLMAFVYVIGGMISFWPATLAVFIVIALIGSNLGFAAIFIIFFAIVIILIIVGMISISKSNKDKSSNKFRQRQAISTLESNCKKDIQASENRYQQDIKRINQEQQNHEKQTETTAAKFYAGNGAPAASMRLAKAVNTGFKAEDNRKHIKIISTNLNYYVDTKGVHYQYKKGRKEQYGVWVDDIANEVFDWVVESFNPLTSVDESEAMALAIANYLSDMYLKKYTNAKIEIIRNDASINMKLHQVNMNYQAPLNV